MATDASDAPRYRLAIGLRTRADWTANLQVFCREKSGNRCPASVDFFPALVRGACGHAGRATHGKTGILRNTACSREIVARSVRRPTERSAADRASVKSGAYRCETDGICLCRV